MSNQRIAWKLFLLVGLATAAAGCRNDPATAEPPPVEVVVSHPVSDKITDWDIYTGTVDARETVEVRSRVRGHVKKVLFKEGDEIAENTELFLIDSQPFEADLKFAKGKLATEQANLELADKKIILYKPLEEKGSISKEELLKAFAEKGQAIGGIDSAKGKIMEAELNIAFCKIASPIAGRIGEAAITTGNLANASGNDSLLATVISVDPMYVYFPVNQRAYDKYREMLRNRAAKNPALKDVPLKVPVELAVGDDPRFLYQGLVDFVDNRVDPTTGSIKVRAKFDNPKGPDNKRALTAGQFARVRISVADPYQAILVADRAILTDQDLKYVLVVNKEKKNLVERVDVTASSRLQANGLRAISAGLTGNEWVIVEGVNRARPGVVVTPNEGKMPSRPTAGK